MILQEIAGIKDSPDEIAYDLIQDAAFPEPARRSADPRHAGERQRAHAPTICARFSPATTAARNMVVSAAGAVDHATIVRHAEALFGGLNAQCERVRASRRQVQRRHRAIR